MSANGYLQPSELARIYDPSMVLYLAKAGGSAAGWNTMNLELYTESKRILLCEGPAGAYRTYAEQVYLKQTLGSNAATPGASNHGLGKAVDVKIPSWMTPYIEQHGAEYGWGKNDAMWEDWHVNEVGIYTRPNPGISFTYPILTIGSGGPGQKPHVQEVQRCLHKHLGKWAKTPSKHYGEFTVDTLHALRFFQKAAGIRVSSVTDPQTWRKLRAQH